MPESSGPVRTGRGRLLKSVGLIVIASGVISSINLVLNMLPILQASGAELRNQASMAAGAVIAEMVVLFAIVAGYQLTVRADEFSWQGVVDFWTKTVLGRFMLVIASALIAILMGLAASVQDGWAQRAGYWIAIWLASTIAVFNLRGIMRLLKRKAG